MFYFVAPKQSKLFFARVNYRIDLLLLDVNFVELSNSVFDVAFFILFFRLIYLIPLMNC